MADISEININDIPYSIKDTQARSTINSVSTNLENYLPLSGGSLTGGLEVQENGIRTKKSGADISASSISNNQYSVIGMTDVNDRYIGYLQGVNYSNGMTAMQLTARKYINNANVDNLLQLRVNASGTKTVTVSDSKIWRNALGASDGVWPIELGGSGLTASPSMLINLSSTTAANVFVAKPRPGITGTLAIEHGGTGQTDTSTDTFNRNTDNTTAGTITYYKWGKVVTVSAYGITLKAQLSANSGILIGSVTSGYRPSTTVVSYSGNSSHPGQVNIATGGGITFYNTSDVTIPKNTNIHFTVTYIIN